MPEEVRMGEWTVWFSWRKLDSSKNVNYGGKEKMKNGGIK